MIKSAPASHSDVLADVIAPKRGDLSRAAARTLLELRFDDDAVKEMNDLAEKNRRGSLTSAERAKMDEYIRVGDFLNLVHAKARRSLKDGNLPV